MTASARHNLKRLIAAGIAISGFFTAVGLASAQTLSLDLGQGGGVTERALQLITLITLLSLAPSVLVMVTSFTRLVVVLSLLRSAIGTQTAPPNTVMIALAIFLTAFIMQPTFTEAYTNAVRPALDGQITLEQAFERGAVPFKTFMVKHVREKDLALFLDLSRETRPATMDDLKLTTIIPAFMISELRRAFEIGFLLFLPFLVIDLVVASILMSAGMMMVPPVTVALPFKLIFFVLVDGWNLVAGSLVKSYGG
ncbi:MAG: flagellar type III secretion system pore protein FliP [Beijerinckiaceae bacterium]